MNSYKIPVPLVHFGGSELVLAERRVALATLKEERAGAARQNGPEVRGALREFI